MTTSFNSKETYLVWRSQWKADYQALSETIRGHKADRKLDPDASRQDNVARQAAAQYKLHVCRKKAAATLKDLQAAKQEAQRQYQAAHCAPAAA